MVAAVQALAGSKEEGEQLAGYRKVQMVDLTVIKAKYIYCSFFLTCSRKKSALIFVPILHILQL